LESIKKKKILVFDTSVISALFHINILEKLIEFKHSFGHDTELILPKEVFDELKNYKEIMKIEHILKQIFKIYEVPAHILKEISLKNRNLGQGELSTLALALHLSKQDTQLSVITIIDDERGRKVADKLRLQKHGTLWLIIYLKKLKIIDKEKAKKAVIKLPIKGFYITNEELKKAVAEIEKDC
jgi:predicted nucleic acid-binding protein